MRILIVDDNAYTAETMAHVVGTYGHDARFAVDAEEAMMLLEEFRPEVALLDLAMPGVDGFELARQIRETGQPVTLVAVTGYRNPGAYAEAAKAGFDAYLPKPVNLQLLKVNLRQWAEPVPA